MRLIPYGRQDISEEDIESVVDVLRSDWLTQGPMVEQFEKAVAAYCGAEHGVAVNSATSALHLACAALNVGPGDVVWTTPNTFVASANCARYCGAEVDFVDIERETYNLCSETLASKLERAEKAGRVPKAIVVVHFGGHSCEMERIGTLARKYGVAVIEDASHAIGGMYQSERVGSCRYADMTVFSFHPVKVMTTAEGGMIVTPSAELAERLRLLRTHGITREPDRLQQEADGPWYYEQSDLGFNYRLSDVHAALGVSQLKRLDGFVARRRVLVKRYEQGLAGLDIQRPTERDDTQSAWHLYPIRVLGEDAARKRRALFDSLRAAGVGVNVHYIPVHLQPYYRQMGFGKGNFPNAEWYYDGTLTLPLYPLLSESDQDFVMDHLRAELMV